MPKIQKLTKNEQNLCITIILIVILIISTCFFSYYNDKNNYLYRYQVTQHQMNQLNLYKDSYTLPSELTNSILPLYCQLIKQDDTYKDKSYAELLLKNYEKLNEDQVQYFNNYIENIQLNYANLYSNIHYYLKNTKTNAVLTNNESIADYITNTDTIDKKNTWYMAFHINDYGVITKWNSSSDKYPASEVKYRLQTSLNDYAFETIGNSIYELNDLQDLDIIFEVTKGSIYEPSDAYDSNFYVDDKTYYTLYNNISKMIFSFTFILLLFAVWKRHKSSKETRLDTLSYKIPIDLHFISLLILYKISCETSAAFIDNVYHLLNLSLSEYIPFIITSLFQISIFILYLLLVYLLGWKAHNLLKIHSFKTFIKHTLIYSLYVKYIKNYNKILTYLSYHQKLKIGLYVFISACFLIIYTFTFGIFIFSPPFFVCIIFPLYCITLFFIFSFIEKKRNVNIMKIKQLTEHIVKEDFISEIPMHCGELEPIKSDLLKIHEQIETAILEERRSQQMKTELITNVSHDLKTPLTSIISYIDLLKKNELSEEERIQYLDILTTSSNRLKHLIEDLFDISKANSGNIQLDYMELDIVALMKQVQLECDTMMKERGLEIRNTFSDNKILWTLDPQKTFRIFHNLLSNISKYALEHTRVYISIHDYQSVLEISMKNISKEEITYSAEELMERFVREDHSRNSEGSGLGLAIVKSFTELQKGSITITTDGDLFKVNLRFQK